MAYDDDGMYGDQDRQQYFSGYDIYQGVSGTYDMYRQDDRSRFLGGYGGERGLGIVPLAIAGGLISGISSLFGGGADKTKYKNRTNTINQLNAQAQAGDVAAITELAYIGKNGHNWGDAYKPLNQAAARAAVAAQAKLAKTVPVVAPIASTAFTPLGLSPTILLAGAALVGGYLLTRTRR